MTFGEKLQRLRRENGLSQLQLAEKLNGSRQAISKWETGAVPDMDNTLKISRFFDCSLDYLMNGEADDEGVRIKPSAGAVCKKSNILPITGGIAAALGVVGILIICILSSVYPAVIYDPPQGEVRAIIETGLAAFLQLYNITWLFVMCVIICISGIAAAVYPKLCRKAKDKK